MLLVIQYPIADARDFVAEPTAALGYPSWPAAQPDRDFVRFFGMVRQRPRGGLSGWVSEHVTCEADNALRLGDLSPYRDGRFRAVVPLRIAFRRFYYDGRVVGKFEIGLHLELERDARFAGVRKLQLLRLARHVLDLPVSIPDPEGGMSKTRLAAAGPPLARLYRLGSTRLAEGEAAAGEEWWVTAGSPLLFLEQDAAAADLAWGIDLAGRTITSPAYPTLRLTHYLLPHAGRQWRAWHAQDQGEEAGEGPLARLAGIWQRWRGKEPPAGPGATGALRTLRLYLLRLHAEKACLQQILRHIAGGKLAPPPRSALSNTLQRYLNDTTIHVLTLEGHANKLVGGAASELAYEADVQGAPGEREALLQTMARLDLRGNVQRDVGDFMARETGAFVRALRERFSLDEMRDICMRLGIEAEDIPGEGRSGFARELVFYCRRRNLLRQLETAVAEMRPDVAWPPVG